MTTVLGIDVSGYQDPEKVNYAELRAHGFGFVVVKLDQYLTEEHVTLARAAGLEVGGYYWNDPLSSPSYQAGRIRREVERLGLRFAALDVEQFWKDWGLYWQWTQKKITLSQLPKFTPAEISENARMVMGLVNLSVTVPWLVYTADWFIQGWAAQMLNWLVRYQTWVAQYVGKNGNITWDQLTRLPWGFTLGPLAGSTPKIWQVSGSFVYPGRSQWDCYDTNLFLGSPADLQDWLGQTPPLPGFMPYQVRSTADLGLRIRTEPNTSAAIVGKLFPYQPAVTILETANGWGRTCAGWISLAWTKKV